MWPTTKPIEYCEYCGRKTITKREPTGGGATETWIQCPKWGSFWDGFIFNHKHSLQLLGYSAEYSGKYNPHTGEKNA